MVVDPSKWRLEVPEDAKELCGQRRGSRATLTCEMPKGHEEHELAHMRAHGGRDRLGRWIFWEAKC